MDRLEIDGLSVLLEEEEIEPPFLELELFRDGRSFHAAILIADDEWVLNLTDDRGRRVVWGEFFPTQAAAIVAAQLAALAEPPEEPSQ